MVIVILAVLNTSQATLVKVTHSVNCLIWFMFNNIHIKNFIIIRRQLNEKVASFVVIGCLRNYDMYTF